MVNNYYIAITVGDHSWSVERSKDKIPDAVEVLAGLQIGWALPQGIGPMQPDPMTAKLGINVPTFEDVSDVCVGTPVAIEIRFSALATDPTFSFYGRTSDVAASPRPGRTGVTLTLAAVDYTVDIADLEGWEYPGAPDDAAKVYNEIATYLWDDRPTLGTLPDWPYTGDDTAVDITDTTYNVLELIKAALIATVPPSRDRRIIIAPLIVGGVMAVQHYVFDVLRKESTATPYVFGSDEVDRLSMQWTRNRRTVPGNTLEATGVGVGPVYATDPDIADAPKVITERLSTISTEFDQLEDQAWFYLSPTDPGMWSLTLQAPLTKVLGTRGTRLSAFPHDFFPQMFLDEGAAGRTACYGRVVQVDGIPPTESPYGVVDAVQGCLYAASVTVARGELVLSMTLRRVEPVTE